MSSLDVLQNAVSCFATTVSVSDLEMPDKGKGYTVTYSVYIQ